VLLALTCGDACPDPELLLVDQRVSQAVHECRTGVTNLAPPGSGGDGGEDVTLVVGEEVLEPRAQTVSLGVPRGPKVVQLVRDPALDVSIGFSVPLPDVVVNLLPPGL
jgi:hypothetical protein